MEEQRTIRREGGLFKCAWCTYTHKWRVCVIQHTAAHHRTTEPLFSCDRCHYSTTNKKDFRRHIERKRPCLPRNQLAAAVVEHANRSRTEQFIERKVRVTTTDSPLPFQCERCDHFFAKKQYLSKHLKKKYPCVKDDPILKSITREGGLYKCAWCFYTHAKRPPVTEHIAQNHHTTENLFKCQQCDYTTAVRLDFRRHLERKIPCKRRDPLAIGLYSCDLCKYTTNNLRCWRVHLNRKTPCIPALQDGQLATFICGHCPFRATSARVLERHVIHRHTINPELQCEVCARIFQTIQAFKAHKLEHETKWWCCMCDFECHNQVALDLHFVVHMQ